MIKGILIDIDNTLYNYENAHKIAMEAVFKRVEGVVDTARFKNAFNIAREEIHTRLKNTASSHNRLLYFQKTLEILNCKDILLSYELYELYWDVFIENIKLYEGVMDFFIKNHKKKKICFITDLTADIQYKKIKKMNLAQYTNAIVTSEEAGIEKPDKKIFILALDKIKLSSDEVCVVGDSYEKDILGAKNLGIKAFWLNDKNKKQDEGVIQFNNFKELSEIIENE